MIRTRPARLLAAGLLATLLGGVAACSGDAEPESSGVVSPTASTSPTASPSPTASASPSDGPSESASSSTPSVTATPSTGGGAAADGAPGALAFFRETEATCRAWAQRTDNPVPPARLWTGARVVGSRGGAVWEVRDGAGALLLVDLAQRKVAPASPGGLPRAYSFGCPSELYLSGALT